MIKGIIFGIADPCSGLSYIYNSCSPAFEPYVHKVARRQQKEGTPRFADIIASNSSVPRL